MTIAGHKWIPGEILTHKHVAIVWFFILFYFFFCLFVFCFAFVLFRLFVCLFLFFDKFAMFNPNVHGMVKLSHFILDEEIVEIYQSWS